MFRDDRGRQRNVAPIFDVGIDRGRQSICGVLDKTFAANRADQAFNEWMRQRRVRHRRDGFHIEDSQIRLPLVESVQRIMVRAEVGGCAVRPIRIETNRHSTDCPSRDRGP